ncbi:hypothetical protein [Aliikangiella maris]|uniref:RDD family protein n=2 Tax=Aliikangiella maris TaxID=3162458 RepID=A0ABV3MUS6_9GAMM
MNDPLKNWNDWQNEWQAYEPDIKKIKSKINWVSWRMGMILLMDIIILIAYVPFILFILMTEETHWIELVWDVVMGILIIYFVYIDFKIRLPIFRAQGDSTRDVLQLYVKRVEAGVTVGSLGAKCCFGVMILFILWILVNYFLPEPSDKLTEIPFISMGIIWFLMFVVIFKWYEKRKQKELKKLTWLWRDYLE